MVKMTVFGPQIVLTCLVSVLPPPLSAEIQLGALFLRPNWAGPEQREVSSCE